MSYGYIYKTTNLVNKNIYIGQHKGLFDPRYFGSGLLVHRALKKYGIKKFKVKLLTTCKTKLILNIKEKEFIAQYRSLFSAKNMYNIADGGNGGAIFKSEESILKIVESRRNNGKPWNSEETKKKIGIGNLGKTRTEEVKKKMRLSHLGIKLPPRSEEWVRKKKKAQLGVSLLKRGHKINCSCFCCKMRRGETIGDNHPRSGKHIKYVHKISCGCPFCKVKRGETTGINNFNYKNGKICVY